VEDLQSTINSAASVNAGPVVTKKLFAQLTGLSEDIVRGMVNRGHLPTVRIGRHRLINVALITKEALEAEYEL
tara:strand:+ start:814 stop:1032 length:219 start_codon:yes stop_codon:yes gene_type:complete